MTDKTPKKIKEIFDSIAEKYDLMNDIISFKTHLRAKERAIKSLKISTTAKVLDLCTGTGDLAILTRKYYPRNQIVGVDFSEKMLKIAKRKCKSIKFIKADCTKLPFEDNSFDIITIGFGLRNIKDSDSAMKEIHRVLKPGGTFMHLDFSKSNRIGDFIFDFITPLIIKCAHGNKIPYKYLIESKQEFMEPSQLVRYFMDFGFRFVEKRGYAFNMLFKIDMKKI